MVEVAEQLANGRRVVGVHDRSSVNGIVADVAEDVHRLPVGDWQSGLVQLADPVDELRAGRLKLVEQFFKREAEQRGGGPWAEGGHIASLPVASPHGLRQLLVGRGELVG